MVWVVDLNCGCLLACWQLPSQIAILTDNKLTDNGKHLGDKLNELEVKGRRYYCNELAVVPNCYNVTSPSHKCYLCRQIYTIRHIRHASAVAGFPFPTLPLFPPATRSAFPHTSHTIVPAPSPPGPSRSFCSRALAPSHPPLGYYRYSDITWYTP